MNTQMTINRASTEMVAGIKSGSELLELARGWLKQGNPVVAIELLQTALDSRNAENDILLRSQVLKEFGRAKMMQSDWEQAERYYIEAQHYFLEFSEYKGASECARNRANMYFQQGNFLKSEELCNQALDFASHLNDHELRASILNTLGAVKSATGDLEEAVKMFKLCLADFVSSKNHIRQGYVLLNIGLSQLELGQFNGSIEHLNQSLAIALEERDQTLVEICYQNISKCYLAQKEYSLAKSVIDTARKILPGLNSQALEVELNLLDCRVLRVTGNIKLAQSLLEDTYQMAIANKQHALIAEILFEQGLLEKELGQIELSLSKLHAASNKFKELGIDKGFQDAIQVIEQIKRK